MSVNVIVSKADGSSAPISVEEWKAFVVASTDLRLRGEQHVATNPSTGAQIRMSAGEADSEILIDGEWLPFLGFRRGRLTTRYKDEFESPKNPFRLKIALIARHFAAVIRTDAGDDELDW